MKHKIGTIIIILLVSFLLWKMGGTILEYKTALEIQKSHIPTFFEIQEELVRRGHNIKVDGIIGTQTLEAWDRELCNQYASKCDWMYQQ